MNPTDDVSEGLPLLGGGEVDPRLVDTDGDGFTDAEERVWGTDPIDPLDYPGGPDPAPD